MWYQEVYTQGWPTATAARTGGQGGSERRQRRSESATGATRRWQDHLHRWRRSTVRRSKLLTGGQSGAGRAYQELGRGLCGRPQHLGLLVPALPGGVRTVRKGLRAVRQASGVPGGGLRGQRRGRRGVPEEHHVSYPSYETTAPASTRSSPGDCRARRPPSSSTHWAPMFVHLDNYTSLGALQADIQAHALGGG